MKEKNTRNRSLGKIIAFLIIGIQSVTYAQEKFTFHLPDDACTYIGSYNPKQVSEEQLKNTLEMISSDFIISFRPLDGKNIDKKVQRLDSIYAQLRDKLDGYDIVKHGGFPKIKDILKLSLNQQHYYLKAYLKSWEDPQILLKVSKDEYCKKLARALHEKGDLLYDSYKEIILEQMKENADPDFLWRSYMKNMESKNKQSIAYNYVLQYGWWNAVNNHITYLNYDEDLTQQYFSIFQKIESFDCEEGAI